MSVLFYRRPDYFNPPSSPINASDCARYVERAKKSERQIPDGLSFDEVLNRKTLPPCSLQDFMDYLVYIEHNAENLQFFLWFRDYECRFNALPEKEKALSPEWIQKSIEVSTLAKDAEQEYKSENRNTIATIIAGGYDMMDAALFTEDKQLARNINRHLSTTKEDGSLASPSFTTPSISEAMTTPTTAEATAQAGLKWQPFTIQPMREEANRVMRHYLAFTAPRELNLSHKDRALVLHALQHTTHPSAFKPAIKITEAALRGQSHPNFIRWSICNGNKPKVFFVRVMGISHILFGFIIGIALTLSRVSRWWRIFAALAFFIGISTMIAAYKGVCVILHRTHVRNLRPWEQCFDDDLAGSRRNSFASTENRDVQMASRTRNHDDSDVDETGSFQLTSMSTFGPKNSFDNMDWVAAYPKKPILKRIFEKSVWTQDETLRILQDRIILGANMWAIIFTVLLTVMFVALPKGNFY